MVKILCTIWALMLHTSGIYIFQTCCVNSISDDTEIFVSGPPIPAFLFATGVYIILAGISLFPKSFQKPLSLILCMWEFISTLFILEFSVSCIWSPLNLLILSTLPDAISHVLNELDEREALNWIDIHRHELMMVLLYILSVIFLLVTLHITNAFNFSTVTEYGIIVSINCAVYRLWQRLVNELSSKETLNDCSAIRNRKKHVNKLRRRKQSFKECDCTDD